MKVYSRRESGHYPPGAEFDPAAPWNEPEPRGTCAGCGEGFNLDDLQEQRAGYELYLCYECTNDRDLRLCEWCGEVVTVSELWAQDISPNDTCDEFEYFCDHCGDELTADRYQGNLDSFEFDYIRATVAESMIAARGCSLPERIALWCAANEPERIADDIAGRLCATFENVRVNGLTQYEANIFRDVALGGWRK